MRIPIKYVFSELVRNALEHARSPGGAFVCAQYYKQEERIAIGIADAGIGILGSMQRSHHVTTTREAITLALQPGITGVTSRIGGNEQNAGAGLFFVKSIAALSRNFLIIYSGDTVFKLLRVTKGQIQLHADPRADRHKFTAHLPAWEGTVVGVNLSIPSEQSFQSLMELIRKAYRLDVKDRKKDYYKQIRFVR